MNYSKLTGHSLGSLKAGSLKSYPWEQDTSTDTATENKNRTFIFHELNASNFPSRSGPLFIPQSPIAGPIILFWFGDRVERD